MCAATEPFVLADFAETFPLWCQPQHASYTRVEDLTRPFLSLLNARFAIASPGDPAPSGWLERGRDREMAIFENPRALERVFVPRRVRFEPERNARIAQMARETDFESGPGLSDPDGEGSARGETANGQARLSLRSSGPDLLITATAASRVLLATSIPAWPGWNAGDETGRLPIVRVNQRLRRVPAGARTSRDPTPLPPAALGPCSRRLPGRGSPRSRPRRFRRDPGPATLRHGEPFGLVAGRGGVRRCSSDGEPGGAGSRSDARKICRSTASAPRNNPFQTPPTRYCALRPPLPVAGQGGR